VAKRGGLTELITFPQPDRVMVKRGAI